MRLYVGATVAVLVLLALGNAKNDSDTSEVYNHFQDVHIAFQGLLCMCADQCKSEGIRKVCCTKLILRRFLWLGAVRSCWLGWNSVGPISAKHGQILLKFGSFESLGQELQQDPRAPRLRDPAAFFIEQNTAKTHRT